MTKLYINKNRETKLIRSHNSIRNKTMDEMSIILKDILRQGTKILVKNSNTMPAPHRGDYYLLFMNEYETVYLFYLDINGVLRIVYSGNQDNAISAIYKFVANDTKLTILKSDNKKAYRVINTQDEDKNIHIVYKNKDGKPIKQVYMTIFEAINMAVFMKKKNQSYHYSVISKSKKSMFYV